MTKRELEEKILEYEINCNEIRINNIALQFNLDQYEQSDKAYLQQIAKLKLTNKKLREKLKEADYLVGALTKNS